jgi:hypothetical protein
MSTGMVHASSYYETAKEKVRHAYDKTKDKSREIYDKASGKAVEGPRVQMESGKMKTSLITKDGAETRYVTKKTTPHVTYGVQTGGSGEQGYPQTTKPYGQ